MTSKLWILLICLASACGPTPQASDGSPASAAALNEQLTFALIGDYGYPGQAARNVANLVLGWQPDLIVTAGDNNYPAGESRTLDDNIGQYYHTMIQFGPAYRGRFAGMGATEQRFFPSLGNHDWYTNAAQPYLRYFALPGHGRYYQVRRGPVHFFIVDSDPSEPHGTSPSSIQGQWLRSQLQQSDASWKVVVLHHPPYSSGPHGSSLWMRWPFAAWGADVVFSGHDHHYERLSVQGFPYYIAGTGGAPLRAVTARAAGAISHALTFRHHGAIKVEATQSTMHVEFQTVSGQVFDPVLMSSRRQ